jgi:hypothetical protein
MLTWVLIKMPLTMIITIGISTQLVTCTCKIHKHTCKIVVQTQNIQKNTFLMARSMCFTKIYMDVLISCS